jgi:hypothetical protein
MYFSSFARDEAVRSVPSFIDDHPELLERHAVDLDDDFPEAFEFHLM